MGIIHKPHPWWASHMPVLIEVLRQTTGPVLELGAGLFSTPLLHILCEVQGRKLISYENDGRFVKQLSRFNVLLARNWDDVPIEGYEVVFIDHKPAQRRKVDIARCVDVPFVVVHDTQPHDGDHLYDYVSIYPLFKYRFDYKKLPVHTSVLSNKLDVNNLLHHSLN